MGPLETISYPHSMVEYECECEFHLFKWKKISDFNFRILKEYFKENNIDLNNQREKLPICECEFETVREKCWYFYFKKYIFGRTDIITLEKCLSALVKDSKRRNNNFFLKKEWFIGKGVSDMAYEPKGFLELVKLLREETVQLQMPFYSSKTLELENKYIELIKKKLSYFPKMFKKHYIKAIKESISESEMLLICHILTTVKVMYFKSQCTCLNEKCECLESQNYLSNQYCNFI